MGHLEQLRMARAALVQARRDQAKALTNPNAKVFSPDAKAFTPIQESIGAIDRAYSSRRRETRMRRPRRRRSLLVRAAFDQAGQPRFRCQSKSGRTSAPRLPQALRTNRDSNQTLHTGAPRRCSLMASRIALLFSYRQHLGGRYGRR